MARYRKIDPRIWNDAKFQMLWNAKWTTPSRVPKQRPWPHAPLPEREELCIARRQRFKKDRLNLLALAIDRLGAECVHCGVTNDLVPDHVIPIAWGGTNDPINIQPSCARCNSARGSTLPEAP